MILIEAIDGVCHKTTERHKECGRKSLVDIRCEVTEIDAASEFKADVETSAHETGKKGYGYAFGEVEIFYGCFLFLFAKRWCFHRTCYADDCNTDESYDNSKYYRKCKLWQRVIFREEDVEQHRSHDCTESGASSEGDWLAESHAKVAHWKSERQTAYSPQRSEKYGHPDVERLVRCEKLAERMSGRYGEKCAEKRKNQPCEYSLYNPVAFPAPRLYLVDGDIAARLTESSYGYD